MQIIKVFIFFMLLVSSFGHSHSCDKPLRIRLITYRDNGFGLTKDLLILKEELERLGHHVLHINPAKRTWDGPFEEMDINIFSQKLYQAYFSSARLNYFMPNPEWCTEPAELLEKCDLILCRSDFVKGIYSEFNENPYYINFTSQDRYKREIPKDYDKPFHSIGRSQYKGTSSLLKVWESREDFPMLLLFESSKKWIAPYTTQAANVMIQRGYVPDSLYIVYQNSSGIHLCPSEAEGFGHYLVEAMSTGAVVITTDAPPMNEYITDKRFLVRSRGKINVKRGVRYLLDEAHLEEVIEQTLALSESELRQVGLENQNSYLRQKKDFLSRMEDLFGKVKDFE